MILHLTEVRTHIQSLLRRNNFHFKSETGSLSHWTRNHLCWIERKIADATGSFKINLELHYQQMKWINHTISECDKVVDELATSEKYKKQNESLVCYKGIKNIFSKVIITEIGDIKRFGHPRQW
tara:strand:- start:1483 stop:1854 length:372 start_codon:yes stop_codon:yes gene_type:complete